MLAALRTLFAPRDRAAEQRERDMHALILKERHEAEMRALFASTCYENPSMQAHCWPSPSPAEGAPCRCGRTRFSPRQ